MSGSLRFAEFPEQVVIIAPGGAPVTEIQKKATVSTLVSFR